MPKVAPILDLFSSAIASDVTDTRTSLSLTLQARTQSRSNHA